MLITSPAHKLPKNDSRPLSFQNSFHPLEKAVSQHLEMRQLHAMNEPLSPSLCLYLSLSLSLAPSLSYSFYFLGR